jgi:hypothetical protein
MQILFAFACPGQRKPYNLSASEFEYELFDEGVRTGSHSIRF